MLLQPISKCFWRHLWWRIYSRLSRSFADLDTTRVHYMYLFDPMHHIQSFTWFVGCCIDYPDCLCAMESVLEPIFGQNVISLPRSLKVSFLMDNKVRSCTRLPVANKRRAPASVDGYSNLADCWLLITANWVSVLASKYLMHFLTNGFLANIHTSSLIWLGVWTKLCGLD